MRALVPVGTVTDDGHKSAAFIEIGACWIALAEVYAHAVEAVQGHTAWAHRTATLRRRKASSRRTGIGGTDPRRLLHQLLAEHYPRFRNRRATEGRALPRYVEDEFEAIPVVLNSGSPEIRGSVPPWKGASLAAILPFSRASRCRRLIFTRKGLPGFVVMVCNLTTARVFRWIPDCDQTACFFLA